MCFDILIKLKKFSSSFGEITFLSLSTFYNRNLSLSGWGSGTGAAGLIGSFGYAGFNYFIIKTKRELIFQLLLILRSYFIGNETKDYYFINAFYTIFNGF